MVEKCKDKLTTYEYYFNIIELMLSDMSDVTLNDIQDVTDELRDEISKIEERNDEMRTN